MSAKEQKEKKEQKEAQKKESEKRSDLGTLEEDDDFEEFPMEDWKDDQENVDDLHVWEDDWDDDDVEDDFSQQLRAELQKNGHVKK